MKGMFKRALAGVAAAALAATGLALGAATANAAPDTPTQITIHNAQPGHTYTAYRFATFDNASDSADGTTSYVEVNTVKTPVDWTQALTTAFNSVQDFTLENQYTANPAAAVAKLTGAQLRAFATGLDPVGAHAATRPMGGDTAGDLVLSVNEGWYLITDTWTNDQGDQSGVKAIVATPVAGATHLTLKLDGGQLNIVALGEVNAKNTDAPDPGDKEVTEINGVDAGQAGTVNFGDVVTYTITDQIPAIAAASDPYSFQFVDTASKGLNIVATSITVEVSRDDQFTTPTELNVPDSNKTVVGDATQGTTTTVTVADVSDYAGQWIRLTYKATVTKDAVDGKVENKASVNHNGDASGDGTPVTLHYGAFNFTKVNVDNAGLANVVFNVYRGTDTSDASQLLKFSADGQATTGAYVYDPTAASADVLTDAEGNLAIRGLKAGTYTVVETSNPDPAYAKNYYAKFTVILTATENGVTTVINTDDANHLVSDRDEDGTMEVLNVKNVTELPLTGAAGTAMFTVLGLLIAGAGALVYMKSRGVKHALRG